MPRTITLASMRTLVRELVDKPGTGYITNAMLNRFIDSAYTELYDILVRAMPDMFYKEETFTGDGSTNTFDVAADYYGTVGVDYQYSTGQYVALHKISGIERNAYNFSQAGIARGWRFLYSTDSMPNIQLLPTPRSGDTYRHTYLKAPATLSADADTIDGVAGFERYIAVKAGISIKIREETNPQDLERELARIRERIKIAADNRAIETPYQIPSSSGVDDLYLETLGLRRS